MGFLAGKRALIVGLASTRSIAWGIAQAFQRQGAELAFTYQNDKLKERVSEMAGECGSSLVLPCDLGSDEQIASVFEALRAQWGSMDIVVHSAAFSRKEELDGSFVDVTTREGFRIAHDISSYSFTALARAARPLMQGRNASLLTLSYMGAVRVVPHYNVMGLAKASLEANVRFMAADLGPEGTRVNAISAGPIRTLAAAGIADFRKMLDYNGRNSPLRRNVTIEEVGNAAAFLCSDLASGISGQVLYVDSGYHVMGMAVAQGDI